MKVTAGAKKELIEKIKDDEYRIFVREPAERNLANERVCELVAHEVGVVRPKVRIISGHHSPSKILSIYIE